MEKETHQKEIEEELNINSEIELKQFYFKYRDEFLRITNRYKLDQETKLDVYQDAMVVLVEAIRQEKLNVQQNLRSYLFGIGKNMIVDKIKAEIKTRTVQEELKKEAVDRETLTLDKIELTHQQRMLKVALEELGKKCQEILTLFYYRKYSIDAIKSAMNYNNDNVVKAHKSRCLKQLREVMKSKDL